MDMHPWTKYEVARLRDEERLLRARAAVHAAEARNAAKDAQAASSAQETRSLLERVLPRVIVARRADARSGT